MAFITCACHRRVLHDRLVAKSTSGPLWNVREASGMSSGRLKFGYVDLHGKSKAACTQWRAREMRVAFKRWNESS